MRIPRQLATLVACLVATIILLSNGVAAFAPNGVPLTESSSSTFRLLAGFGAVASVDGTASSRKAAVGMGNSKTKKKAKASAFDIAASVLRHTERYDQLLLEAARLQASEKNDDDSDSTSSPASSISDPLQESYSTTEYVVTARDKTRAIVADWVPIGHLLVCASLDTTEAEELSLKQACVSYYCRELSHLASSGSRRFAQLPRNDMEYALETIDSFQKHVYERVLDNGKQKQVDPLMSVDDAKAILQIDPDDVAALDLAAIKRQYRKLSFEHHPDRHDTDDAKETAGAKYAEVLAAFDRLTQSGMIRKSGSSWYESLGGKARTDFTIVSLLNLQEAQRVVEASSIHKGSAVSGMEPDIVQTFVARSNAAASRS